MSSVSEQPDPPCAVRRSGCPGKWQITVNACTSTVSRLRFNSPVLTAAYTLLNTPGGLNRKDCLFADGFFAVSAKKAPPPKCRVPLSAFSSIVFLPFTCCQPAGLAVMGMLSNGRARGHGHAVKRPGSRSWTCCQTAGLTVMDGPRAGRTHFRLRAFRYASMSISPEAIFCSDHSCRVSTVMEIRSSSSWI